MLFLRTNCYTLYLPSHRTCFPCRLSERTARRCEMMIQTFLRHLTQVSGPGPVPVLGPAHGSEERPCPWKSFFAACSSYSLTSARLWEGLRETLAKPCNPIIKWLAIGWCWSIIMSSTTGVAIFLGGLAKQGRPQVCKRFFIVPRPHRLLFDSCPTTRS